LAVFSRVNLASPAYHQLSRGWLLGFMTVREAQDAALMMDVAAGDRAAFGELMQFYMPLAYRTAYRLLNNAGSAEELAQEALLRVWRHASAFDAKRAKFSTWLYQIVTNLAFDRLRKQRRAGAQVGLEAAEELADMAPDAEAQMIAQAERRAVVAALATLPERQRAVVVLVHYEGLSVREAAAALSMTPKAVESLLYRSLKALRVILLGDKRLRSLN
jgi:RNA polymerase sigma-70 factor, ECF subfamily